MKRADAASTCSGRHPRVGPGPPALAQMLRDTGAPDGLVAGLLADDAGPLDLDSAARHLISGPPRLIVVDDVDRGGADGDVTRARVLAKLARANCWATRRRRPGGARWSTKPSSWPAAPRIRASWPRSSTPACTPCGTPRAPRTGWRPGRKSSTWPEPRVTTGANATVSSGGSWL
jgi:hypothetical protein